MNTRWISMSLGLFLVFALGVLAITPVSTTLAQSQAGTTLSAIKTATGYWERRIDWDISKDVEPEMLDLPCNGEGTVTYTITVTKWPPTDVYGVRGKICVTNGGERFTKGLKLVDQVEYKVGRGQFEPLYGASQTIIPSEQLSPGETKCYDYDVSFTPVAGAQYRNVVKVTITNHSGHLGEEFGPEPKEEFTLPGEPTYVEGFDTIHVDDTNGNSWEFSTSGSVTYDKTFKCPEDEGWQCNRACIRETGECTDSVCVNVKCEPCPQHEWCSPGYWRQPQHRDSWEATDINPNDHYNTFADAWQQLGCPGSFPENPTLWEVLRSPKTYARTGAYECVADLLSWRHPDVDFEPGDDRSGYCPLH